MHFLHFTFASLEWRNFYVKQLMLKSSGSIPPSSIYRVCYNSICFYLNNLNSREHFVLFLVSSLSIISSKERISFFLCIRQQVGDCLAAIKDRFSSVVSVRSNFHTLFHDWFRYYFLVNLTSSEPEEAL